MEELLSLKWNNHRSTFLHILTILRDKQLYTDATLACDGRFYSVHRLVLSTCSDYFSAIFDRTTCKNPIIVLKDIKCEDLEALLDYMYLGEVNVRQADLASLIKAAECLRVKGLAVPDDEPPQKRGRSDSSNLRKSEGSPASKRKRREDGYDGREEVRPASSLPKTSQSQSRLSPQPQDSEAVSPNHLQQLEGGNAPSGDGEIPFVKVEREDPPGEDSIPPQDTFNINSDGYKEEAGEDTNDPGGDLSNDLPEFLNQATSSHLGASSFGHGSFAGSSSFQSSELGWQGEGSNLNFPGHLNFSSSTESSSQNAPGVMDHPVGRQNMQQLLHVDQSTVKGVASPGGWKGPQAQMQIQRPVCSICGHRFRWRWMLVRHMKIHTGEKPFSCPYCPYRAPRKEQVRNHVIHKHNNS